MPDVVDLGYRPRPWQHACHLALRRFSVLVCHRRAGKTVFAIMTLIDAALRTQKAKARYAYLAPYLKQAKAVAWDMLRSYAAKVPGCIINESELWVELPNGARIRIFGGDNPDALRGIYLDGVVMDEVADMRPDVWGEIIRPALADRLGWALFIGTPKGMNLFSELYFAAQGKSDWYAGLFTVNDTDALDPAEVAAARDSMSENQYRQEFLCDFAAGSSNTLMSVMLVQDAAGRHLRSDQFDFAPKILGVDVARYGDDRSCIFRRQGLASFTPIIMRKEESFAVAGRVAQEIKDWQPDAVFIDSGAGMGVVDCLRQWRHSVVEVPFAGKPDDPRYLNKRAEMWSRMAEWLKGGGAIPNDPALKLDLCTPTYTLGNAANKIQLESKDDIKKRGMPSPDSGDALALTFAFHVAPRGNGQARGMATAISDYDPYA